MHPSALLDHCAALLGQALRFEHPADAVAARYFRDHHVLGPRERAVAMDTLYAVLRRKLRFEHFAGSEAGMARRLAVLGFAAEPHVKQAALSEEEKHWLAACNGVDPALLPAACRHNLPSWLAERLQAQRGAAFEGLADSLLETAPLDVRVNVLAEKREAVRLEMAQAGFASSPTVYSSWGLRFEGKPSLQRTQAYLRGAFEVQDEGSQLLALMCGARRSETVVDFCAGAGGKTLALGAAMRNTGRLYAFDTSAHRLHAMKPRLERSGLTNVHPLVVAHENDARIGRLAGKVDRVLVDAPCTGLGTLRRNPDLKWRQSPSDLNALVARQTSILQAAARLLKPGGRLVYATCSLLVEENEAIAEAFGRAHPNFHVQAAATLLATARIQDGEMLCSADGLYLRLWPHLHGTDGFFAAAWTRT